MEGEVSGDAHREVIELGKVTVGLLWPIHTPLLMYPKLELLFSIYESVSW